MRAEKDGERGLIVENGYIKIFRKTIESQVFANAELFKLWMWCLLKAAHKERWVSMNTGRGETEIKLNPGQFIFGRKSAAHEMKMTESGIWKRMQKLKNLQNLNIESNNKYSIITIINWDTYQGSENNSNSESNREVTAKEQRSNTNKNVKNVKNKEYSEDFLKFYDAYPNKIDKKRAFISWGKNKNKPDIEIILDAIEKQKNWRATANGEWRPEWKHPATWINNDCWEDELENSSRLSNKDDEFLMVRP